MTKRQERTENLKNQGDVFDALLTNISGATTPTAFHASIDPVEGLQDAVDASLPDLEAAPKREKIAALIGAGAVTAVGLAGFGLLKMGGSDAPTPEETGTPAVIGSATASAPVRLTHRQTNRFIIEEEHDGEWLYENDRPDGSTATAYRIVVPKEQLDSTEDFTLPIAKDAIERVKSLLELARQNDSNRGTLVDPLWRAPRANYHAKELARIIAHLPAKSAVGNSHTITVEDAIIAESMVTANGGIGELVTLGMSVQRSTGGEDFTIYCATNEGLSLLMGLAQDYERRTGTTMSKAEKLWFLHEFNRNNRDGITAEEIVATVQRYPTFDGVELRNIERPTVLGSSFKYTSPTYNFVGDDVEAKMYQQIERRAQMQIRDGKAVFYTEAQEKDLVFRQRELDIAFRRHGAHVDPAGTITINSTVVNDYKRQVDLYERQATAERAAPTTRTR